MTATPPEARTDRASEVVQEAQNRVDRLRTMYPHGHTPILREAEAYLNGALAVQDALAAECERMRPVVEAAAALRQGRTSLGQTAEFRAAVDAYLTAALDTATGERE